ncbi:hypothetical protein AMS68_005348 [Peltaster fructicola]|uniref:RRM domain-containing protein n=1 Tax=Peltaster fructicola TaxID=286661 RepID=A0A6H0XYU5_9PEZI|nr:hypothetical protein AMS68_005348 [Peltaster fructicola]
MSGKLDQSLDAIMKESKTARRGRGGRTAGTRRAATAAKAKIAAPAGGISKNTKQTKGSKPTGPIVNAPTTGESKIIVSGLPEDVDETQIKDYFTKTVGHVKKAMLTYGPQGRSRGVATLIFSKPGSAAEAAQQLNGVKVDGRAMRIEVVVGAKNVTAAPAKTLGDRITSQPKSAARTKPVRGAKDAPKAAAPNGAKPARGGKKSGRAGRPKPKTSEELDAEMQDYFGGDSNGAVAAPAAPAQPAANDANMDIIS